MSTTEVNIGKILIEYGYPVELKRRHRRWDIGGYLGTENFIRYRGAISFMVVSGIRNLTHLELIEFMSTSLPAREEKLTQLFHVTAEKYWDQKKRSPDLIDAEGMALLKSVDYPANEFLDFVENIFGLSEDHLNWKLKQAERGDMGTQSNLAYMYFNGFGVERDYAKALFWYKRAAEQGAVSSQCAAGYIYANGLGVPQDYTEAISWYKRAAELGSASAQDSLGYFYANGLGVEQDPTQGFSWYSKAAEQGSVSGQSALAYLYLNGLGVDQDYAKAAHWFEKSAERGSAFSQLCLGRLYLQGKGVSQDQTKAIHWLAKSATQGDAEARKELIKLGQTPDTEGKGTS